MKTLSVVVPVYNMEKYLGRCLDSLLDDDINHHLEIICVNDGSKDSSLNIMKEYAQKYPETVRYIDKPNGGHGSTVNAGITAATGEFFKVVDSDDWVNKINFVSFVKELDTLLIKDVDLVVSAYSREEIYEGRRQEIFYNLPVGKSLNFLYANCLLDQALDSNYEKYFTMACSTYRTKILKDSSYRLTEKSPYVDMEYNAYYIKDVKNVYYINKSIYCYFIGREDQSVAGASMVKNYAAHETILRNLIAFYENVDFSNIAYKRYLRKMLLLMINTHYMIQGVFRHGKDQKEGNELIREFDNYLKNTANELYDTMANRKYIARGRRGDFSKISFNYIQYAIGRKKEGKRTLSDFLKNSDLTYDVIVGGAGYAGSIMARKFAEDGQKVLLVDRRDHIGGNMYDYKADNGILVHQYGPHIAYMETDEAFNFLSNFTEWNAYEHRVNVEIQGKQVPLPFNLTGIDIMFDKEKAERLKDVLIKTYGMDSKVPILEMLNSDDKDLNELAQFVYDNVFVDYTTKMWGLDPKEISPSVTARIPVRVNHDDRHFTNRIQVMPKDGYTRIFENMLNHENIEILLGTNIQDVVTLDIPNNKILYKGQPFKGKYVYTGALDELLDYKYGDLTYRSLEFKFENHLVDRMQETGTLNWPDKRPETRRSEMKIITSQEDIVGETITLTEYPGEYNRFADKWNEPYYPVPSDDNESKYKQYNDELSQVDNLILVGRMAEYKYYNMEAIILKALELYEKVCD